MTLTAWYSGTKLNRVARGVDHFRAPAEQASMQVPANRLMEAVLEREGTSYILDKHTSTAENARTNEQERKDLVHQSLTGAYDIYKKNKNCLGLH